MRHGELIAFLEPLLASLDYVLWGIETEGQCLRVYIDKQGGVTIDDCTQIGRKIRTWLAVEQPQRTFTLEVSSPGIPRPLFTPSQYQLYVTQMVSLKLNRLVHETRKITGQLQEVLEDSIKIQVGDTVVSIPFSYIGKAYLIGE